MGHEFENNFTFDWDLLQRATVSMLIFLAGIVAAWLLPVLLRFIFRGLLGSEIFYHAPDHDAWYDQERDHRRRRRYAHASYWRTSFFDLFYVVVGLSAFVSGIVIALWLLHWDFWYLVAGLGLYTAIALFQVGSYLQNVFAFFCLKMDYQCHVREGDYIAVAGHQGVLAYIGLQRSKLILMPLPSSSSSATPPSSLASPSMSSHAQQQQQQQQQQSSYASATHHLHTRPVTGTNSFPTSHLLASSATSPPQHLPSPSKVVFVPTAYLMQTVVRIERAY